MSKRYRSPWWVGCRWEVQAKTPQGWKAIYCSKTKSGARKDAAEWHARMGQQVKVVPGPGHKTKR